MDKLPRLADIVAQYGLSADKRLGQHFLLDLNITDKIARLAQPLSDVTIIEIGPGPGGLTRSLFRTNAHHVIVIETDTRFVPALEDIQSAVAGTLDIIQGDALHIDMSNLSDRPIKIIANLPYNVGTKLLINWIMAEPLYWVQAVLMFQKEVAERIVAHPGDKAYGRLAVLCQSVCACHMSHTIPARAFTPPPKIDSAVVVLDPYPQHQRFSDLTRLGHVTQAAFGQRRKMLRRSLKSFAERQNVHLDMWLDKAGIDPTRRPETVSVSEFHTLVKALPCEPKL